MVRYMLSLALAVAIAVPVLAQATREVKAVKVKGKLVKVQGTDQYVVQTADNNKEVAFYTNTATRYMVNGKPVKFGDFKAGNEVTVVYVPEGERYIVQQIYVGDEPKDEPETYYEGEIVKVVGKDQVIIRTADKKEITVYVHPKTTYQIEEKEVRFTDLQPGTPVRVDYVLEERRPMARSFRGLPRRR